MSYRKRPRAGRSFVVLKPLTKYGIVSLGANSDLVQDGLVGSPIASPQLQKSLQRRRRVVLVVVVRVGEDGLSLIEEAIHDARPPQ